MAKVTLEELIAEAKALDVFRERQDAKQREHDALEATLIERIAAYVGKDADGEQLPETLGKVPFTKVRTATVTTVRGSTSKRDDAALQAKVTAATWKAITKTVVDTELLKAAVLQGKTDKATVESVTTRKDSKPYIKISG